MDEIDEKPIELVEYDPLWAERYESAAEAVGDALGERLERTEHIGSTSVPGLAAKPIVDLRAMVEPGADLDDCAATIEAETDFRYHSDLRHWKFLRKPGRDDRVLAYNLHLTHVHREEWRKNVLLREYLREHPEAREEYAAVKRAAAERHPENIAAYTDEKADFIERCVEAARAEGLDERL
jgi:GrpB-like predicted nucleotidyltransferase (UPF0157 family)